MKRLLMLLACLLLVLPAACGEEAPPIQVEVELETDEFFRPQDILLTIRIINVSGADLPGPMALYDPNGYRVEDFGLPTLKAGEKVVWSGIWPVSQAQIDDGRIIFAVRYTVLDDTGNLAQETQCCTAAITQAVRAYYNPDGGSRYHADQHCPALSEQYWEMLVAISANDLSRAPYDRLTPCSMCGAGALAREGAWEQAESWLAAHAGLDGAVLDALYVCDSRCYEASPGHPVWRVDFATAGDVLCCTVVLELFTGRIVGYTWHYAE